QLFAAGDRYNETGGIHAAALTDGTTLLFHAEDIGRHNAVDKVIGGAVLARTPIAGRGLLVTGRISAELAFKAARAGLAWVVTRARDRRRRCLSPQRARRRRRGRGDSAATSTAADLAAAGRRRCGRPGARGQGRHSVRHGPVPRHRTPPPRGLTCRGAQSWPVAPPAATAVFR